MNVRELMDRALFALSVPKCIGCGNHLDYRQKAFCPKCYDIFADHKYRNCSRCAKKLSECNCSNDFLSSHYIRHVIKCYRYSSNLTTPSNKVIFSLKKDNRADVLELLTDELSKAILISIESPDEYIFTNIPRRKSAIIEYGIDHSEMLARSVAKRLGTSYVQLLRSTSKRAQKSLDIDERRKNASFNLVRSPDLTNKRVIIVDDIITSGASMVNAAMHIRSLGCKDITAACIAIAYKDS